MSTNDSQTGRQDHIEQIRDIILGPQKTEFDAQWKKLDSALGVLRAEVAKHRKELTGEFASGLAAAMQSVDKQLEAIRSLQSGKQEEVRARFERLEHSLAKELDSLRSALTDASSSLQAKLDESYTKLEKQVCESKEDAARELQNHVAALREDHIPRAVLGDLLAELGAKIRDAAAVPDAEGLDRKKNHGRR